MPARVETPLSIIFRRQVEGGTGHLCTKTSSLGHRRSSSATLAYVVLVQNCIHNLVLSSFLQATQILEGLFLYGSVLLCFCHFDEIMLHGHSQEYSSIMVGYWVGKVLLSLSKENSESRRNGVSRVSFMIHHSALLSGTTVFADCSHHNRHMVYISEFLHFLTLKSPRNIFDSILQQIEAAHFIMEGGNLTINEACSKE